MKGSKEMKKTLEEILVTYQKKKEKKEKENELIKKELYRKYPEFDEIERKIAKLYLQKSIKNLTIKKQNMDKGEFIKIDEISNIDKEIKKLEEKKEVTSTTETEPNTDTKNKDNHEYVSNYRYVYEAVGGDDFTVVSKLTGVDVDTLSKANSLSKDVVFKKGDRIFVP